MRIGREKEPRTESAVVMPSNKVVERTALDCNGDGKVKCVGNTMTFTKPSEAIQMSLFPTLTTSTSVVDLG